jgi:membrane-bound ClpP family serine protease
MIGRYLVSLGLTLIIEGAVAYLLGFRKNHFFLALALINVITNPILNYLLLVLGFLGIEVTLIRVFLLEIAVVIAEWRLLVYAFGSPSRRFLILSILANAASFLAGVLIFWTG